MKTSTEVNLATDDVAPTSNVNDTAGSVAASKETMGDIEKDETSAEMTAATKNPEPVAIEDSASKSENEDDDDGEEAPNVKGSPISVIPAIKFISRSLLAGPPS